MADQKVKDSKPKDKPAKAEKPAAKPDKEPKADKAAEAAAEPKAKPEPPARPPADPRLKVMKKFQGRFLPKGPLRDRYKAIAVRWASEADRAGVTLDELKSLHQDWRASREKPAKIS